MRIPGFAAEASLYKSGRVYRCYCGGHPATGVFAANLCADACDAIKDVCEAACGFDFVCLGGCLTAYEVCKATGVCDFMTSVCVAAAGLDPDDVASCIAKGELCNLACSSGNGGGGAGAGGGTPPPPTIPCCPTSAPRCCGTCPKGGGRCIGECIRSGEKCP